MTEKMKRSHRMICLNQLIMIEGKAVVIVVAVHSATAAAETADGGRLAVPTRETGIRPIQ
jgi:hypothetical protein